MDHSFKVFKKVMSGASKFPAAQEFSRAAKVIILLKPYHA